MTGAEALRLALSGRRLLRSLCVMLVVGSILNIINQGEIIFYGGEIAWIKGILTFIVPFCVSTFSARGSVLESARETFEQAS